MFQDISEAYEVLSDKGTSLRTTSHCFFSSLTLSQLQQNCGGNTIEGRKCLKIRVEAHSITTWIRICSSSNIFIMAEAAAAAGRACTSVMVSDCNPYPIQSKQHIINLKQHSFHQLVLEMGQLN